MMEYRTRDKKDVGFSFFSDERGSMLEGYIFLFSKVDLPSSPNED